MANILVWIKNTIFLVVFSLLFSSFLPFSLCRFLPFSLVFFTFSSHDDQDHWWGCRRAKETNKEARKGNLSRPLTSSFSLSQLGEADAFSPSFSFFIEFFRFFSRLFILPFSYLYTFLNSQTVSLFHWKTRFSASFLCFLIVVSLFRFLIFFLRFIKLCVKC